jgi:hypothetical protein
MRSWPSASFDAKIIPTFAPAPLSREGKGAAEEGQHLREKTYPNSSLGNIHWQVADNNLCSIPSQWLLSSLVDLGVHLLVASRSVGSVSLSSTSGSSTSGSGGTSGCGSRSSSTAFTLSGFGFDHLVGWHTFSSR